ncbi:NADH:flavin oxidoreductase/NADH oxidase [Intrasporangium calvum]|uniref:NADH:flavin oxidoreductase/NADH oxidase n=1 Tax=Intrasporangium calvum TaxID=53358 RepID=A0ABT5GE45_9MICO|nr:NADH:flavin oxidoreductase/NADH oxidase [Intrasporangium calvum]MDC5696531.1 NADH:flavin oxidoreductase/NADH oxidase [Intrasporangium calvum]
MSKTTADPRLFQPIDLRGLRVPHRLWVAAMCQYSASEGVPAPWHHVHLGSFAIGRAGLVITEATAVSPVGRISSGDTGIWTDQQADEWASIVDFSHGQGVPMAVQLAHAGRKASTRTPSEGRGALPFEEGGWPTVGPSPIPYGRLPAPRELTTAEIGIVVADFAAAAARATAAGFDAVEIHAAHGYLQHQFMSPLSNERTDHYGGSFENRIRLTCEIVDAVRAVIPAAMPLLIRVSATDWVEGGWSLADTVRLAGELEQRGIDFISVSSAGNDHRQEIAVGPGYQLPLAREIRRATSLPVGAAGLITSPQQAETALVDEAADVIFAARQFLREPSFALRAAAELGGFLEWPVQYRMARFQGSIP